jgi:hypothetical protein
MRGLALAVLIMAGNGLVAPYISGGLSSAKVSQLNSAKVFAPHEFIVMGAYDSQPLEVLHGAQDSVADYSGVRPHLIEA